MDRKILIPLIAVAAFLLLVIGAGVTVVAVQIRKNAPPTFTQTDRYLRQIPATSGWTFVGRKAEFPIINRWSGWWNLFGMRRTRPVEPNTYTLSHQASTGRGKVIIGRYGDEVVRVAITGSFDEQAVELENTFFHQFPKLKQFQATGRGKP